MMRFEEEFVGPRTEFAELLRKIADQIAADELTIRNRKLTIPDTNMEYKISHKFHHGENKLTIGIEWLERDSLV
jgi:amphi-Trp domain-containing protein